MLPLLTGLGCAIQHVAVGDSGRESRSSAACASPTHAPASRALKAATAADVEKVLAESMTAVKS
jgi:hypothetical protein